MQADREPSRRGVRRERAHHGHHRPGRDVVDQVREEGPLAQVLVVLLRQLPRHDAQAQRAQREPLALQAADDLAHQAALHAVRLYLRGSQRARQPVQDYYFYYLYYYLPPVDPCQQAK